VGDIGDPAMLAEIGAAGRDPYDIVLANAALQWVPNHERVLTAWTAMLAPGGQLAVQVPANVDHPSHTTSAELAAEEPYLSAFGGEPPPDPVHSVLKPEEYATFLHDLGYVEQHVRLQVYGHVLPGPDAVVEWVKGTSLTRFSERLPAELFEEFLAEYRKRLTDRLQNRSPYFYAFKRILVWARLGS
jgi:trans-aconitate 2-methyltransferase